MHNNKPYLSKCSMNLGRTKKEGLVNRKLVEVSPDILLLAVPRRLFRFGSLVILDMIVVIECISCYIKI